MANPTNLTLEDYTAAQRKIYDAYATDQIKKEQAAVDNSVAAVKAQGEKDIESTKTSYEDQFRKNNLQQIINEEQVKERMANLGLTDSGLNRSQQTAIQLQRSNADAATIRKRQAAMDEIRRGIAEYVATAEAQKAEIDSTVRSNWMQKADENAVALYNQQEANNAAIRAAEIEAENKKAEAQAEATAKRQAAWNELASAYASGDYTTLQKKVLYDNFVSQYDISEAERSRLDGYITAKANENKPLPIYDRTFTKIKDTNNYEGNLWTGFGLFGGGSDTIDWNDVVSDGENELTLEELKKYYGFTDAQLMELTKLRKADGGIVVTKPTRPK